MAGHIIDAEIGRAFQKRRADHARRHKANLLGTAGPASPARHIVKPAAHLATAAPSLGAPALGIVSPEALKKRRLRARQKAGGAAPDVPLRDINGTIELVLDLRWLPVASSKNRREVGKAVGRLIDDLTTWANAMRAKHGPQWTDRVTFQWSNDDHDPEPNSG